MNDTTERRTGMRELADAINCLKDEFVQTKVEVFNKLNAHDKWIENKADPILDSMRKAMWVMTGASTLAVVVMGLALYIWQEDHAVLTEVHKWVLRQVGAQEERDRRSQIR